MVFLNLAYIMFSRTIPWWIGQKLPSLTHLQLRSNLFSGDIPTQLTELHNLLFLDLTTILFQAPYHTLWLQCQEWQKNTNPRLGTHTLMTHSQVIKFGPIFVWWWKGKSVPIQTKQDTWSALICLARYMDLVEMSVVRIRIHLWKWMSIFIKQTVISTREMKRHIGSRSGIGAFKWALGWHAIM